MIDKNRLKKLDKMVKDGWKEQGKQVVPSRPGRVVYEGSAPTILSNTSPSGQIETLSNLFDAGVMKILII